MTFGRLLALLVTLWLVAPPVALGQSYSQGYLALGDNGHLYHITPGGTVTSALIDPGGLGAVVMDVDNATALVATQTGRILRVDPTTFSILGTLAAGLGQPVALARDHNGDMYVADMIGKAVMRVSRQGAATTVLRNPGVLRLPYGGLLVSQEFTDLFVQEADPALRAPLYRLPRTGGSLTTMAVGSTPGFAIAQHLPTGDVYSASLDLTNTLIYHLKAGGTRATTWLAPGNLLQGVASVAMDRASATAPRLLLGAFNLSSRSRGLYTVDLNSRSVTRVADIPVTLRSVAYHRSANLTSFRTHPHRWALWLNFPSLPGREYAVLPSLHGIRPVQQLPDGRQVCLVPDGITAHMVFKGDIFPFTSRFRGRLDQTGSSFAVLDLRWLPSYFDGMVVWLLPIVFDPWAPWSVGIVGDPLAIQIE